MADKRKLQGDIDRCLKKVSEGVEQFEDIWQKVHSASNANQKEKYEADLKKEIKKLQRLRDQIKTWLTSNDIKDKTPLMDNRKLIETQMERFKAVERETKTKAYSKEGLGLAAKVDPIQKEKEELRSWLADQISKLNIQIDQFESEMESLYAGTKKKKIDKDKSERVQELQEWVEKHKFHIQKSETMMRMMDNCSLDTSQVKEIQDDLNYYVESNQDVDFIENEMMYDDMDLEEVQSSVYTNVPGTSAPNQVNEVINSVEDVPNSLPNSSVPPPSKENPLSPKTPTAVKSTSQELFDERRRGKTSISSSETVEAPVVVPPSPGKPPKSVSQSSSSTSVSSSASRTGGISLSKMSTTTGKSNSSGGSSRSRSNSSSTVVVVTSSVASVTGNSSRSTTRTQKPNQLPHGHGYAVVAGGAHQQINSHPQTPTSSHPDHAIPTSLLSSSSSTTSASTPTPSLSTSSVSFSGGHFNQTISTPHSSVISFDANLSDSIHTGNIGNCGELSSEKEELSLHEKISSFGGDGDYQGPLHLQPLSAHAEAQAGSYQASLVYTSNTSQPRPVGPSSQNSQHSEHSQTNSTSSFSPSTLSQDSQPVAPFVLSQPSFSQPSNGTISGSGSFGIHSGISVVGAATSLSSIQSTTISTSGPPSVDTSHFSPSSQGSAVQSPNPPQIPSSVSFTQSNPTSAIQPHLSSFFQQQQQQQPMRRVESNVTQKSMPAQPSNISVYHNRSDNVDLSGSTAIGGMVLLPGQTSISSSTSSFQMDYGTNLPSWLSRTVSIGDNNISAVGSGSDNDAVLTSNDPNTQSHEHTSAVGSNLHIDDYMNSGGLPTNSMLSSAVVSKQQVMNHSHFTSSFAPIHLPQTVMSSGLSTSSSETSSTHRLQTIEAQKPNDAPSSLKAMAAQVVAKASSESLSPQPPQTPSGNSSSENFKTDHNSLKLTLSSSIGVSAGSEVSSTALSRNDTQLHPLLGVTPLGQVSLTQEKIYQLKMLDVAFRHLPQPSDSEKVRPCIQRFLCPTPFYHHQHPPSNLDSFEFFQRLSIETLFFIFYYMEGSKAQYLAAKALKKLSWRFHTKYMMWFQRLEEPKAITDDYEMGTYIYFDFEKWSQRKKEGFTFEYRYLEDKDLP